LKETGDGCMRFVEITNIKDKHKTFLIIADEAKSVIGKIFYDKRTYVVKIEATEYIFYEQADLEELADFLKELNTKVIIRTQPFFAEALAKQSKEIVKDLNEIVMTSLEHDESELNMNINGKKIMEMINEEQKKTTKNSIVS